MVIGALIIGLAAGAAVAWLVARARAAADSAALRAELAVERDIAAERERALDQVGREFSDRFDALAADALRKNNESFLELASGRLGQKEQAVQQLVRPLEESLKRVTQELGSIEKSRREDYGALSQHVKSLTETSERVRAETASLATALRSSEVRGAWGQMQLRNAVETAGMLAYCDFNEQVSTSVDGRVLRPDMVVRLPGGRSVIVDAKTPLKPLLDAAAAPEDERARYIADYVRHVREHARQLSAKSYWQQFEDAPDYVFMFLPGEGFYRTAIEEDPSLLELSGANRVIIVSPMVLVTLLRTIACVWNDAKVAESARTVRELGRELYDRLTTMTDHFSKLGRRLDDAVQEYNKSIGSFERRVLPQARKFTEHGIQPKKELQELEAIERTTQQPHTVEMPVARTDVPALPHAADAA